MRTGDILCIIVSCIVSNMQWFICISIDLGAEVLKISSGDCMSNNLLLKELWMRLIKSG